MEFARTNPRRNGQAVMKDQDRLRAEYARRAQDPRYAEWYARTNASNRFIEADRDTALKRAFAEFPQLLSANARVLDVGCGAGHELAKLQQRLDARNLFGVDLLWERVRRGKEQYPLLNLFWSDASHLPFRDGAFDLAMQFTMFSSILDDALRRRIASEMLRVLKPRGAVLWYDYFFNPTNAQTRGIGKRELRALFPKCSYHVWRVTLAPPLARWLAPRSLAWCARLNRLPWLRSHYLALVIKD